jgi:hypothetical protein
MRNIFALVTAIFLLVCATASFAAVSPEEKKLDDEISALNKRASQPAGEKVVVRRLENQFKVKEAEITSLRDKKLGYGEIAIVLAMAQKMPGGITDANVNQILSLRQGTPPKGWGEIAKELKLGKLGTMVSNVERVRRSAEHSGTERMHGEQHEMHERPGR